MFASKGGREVFNGSINQRNGTGRVLKMAGNTLHKAGKQGKIEKY